MLSSVCSLSEVEELIAAFEDCTLPREQWSHHAHLLVGYWYVSRYPVEEATVRVREGIQKYNAAYGVAMTPTGGYHETITIFFIHVISRFIESYGRDHAEDEIIALLLQSPCADKHYLFEFYSKERLFSWEARTSYLEPDLISHQ